jgi:hypothetical protein
LLINQIFLVVLYRKINRAMNNLIEELKRYFEETPHEKVLEDWAKSAEFDNIGIAASEFICSLPYVYSAELHQESQQNVNNNCSPKFTSGFFLKLKNLLIYANSCIFNI